MQCRQKLAYMVISGEMNLSEAARQFAVSRPTAHKWVQRALVVGVENLAEQSRAPHQQPRHTEQAIIEQILTLKRAYPRWGAKKLHALLWPPDGAEEAPICVRTTDRLLRRRGLVIPRAVSKPAVGRFERGASNELWQLDFKGIEKRWDYIPLSVLDDHSRFCLALHPAMTTSGPAAWNVLWDAFGEFGLPECILCDNYASFNSLRSPGPTWLQSRLWLLGIKTCHGRPAHPQTQGKVERFHKTLEEEAHDLIRQPNIPSAFQAFKTFRQSYNWVRPHEALGMKPPGAVYQPSERIRPSQPPKHELPEGALVRKVDMNGRFTIRCRKYQVGQGLSGQYVEMREEKEGLAVYFAGIRIAAIEEIRLTF